MSERVEIKKDEERRLTAFFNLLPNEVVKEGLAETFIIAQDIRTEMISSMENTPRTGRINKKVSKSSKRRIKGIDRRSRRMFSIAGAVRRSSPGNPPAPDTGELIRSTVVDERTNEIEVGVLAGAPYAIPLEEGSKNMDARPFMQPALGMFSKEIEPRIANAMEIAVQESRNRLT